MMFQKKWKASEPLLTETFADYHGTIISGGTKTGISKLAGDIKHAFPDHIHTTG